MAAIGTVKWSSGLRGLDNSCNCRDVKGAVPGGSPLQPLLCLLAEPSGAE